MYFKNLTMEENEKIQSIMTENRELKKENQELRKKVDFISAHSDYVQYTDAEKKLIIKQIETALETELSKEQKSIIFDRYYYVAPGSMSFNVAFIIRLCLSNGPVLDFNDKETMGVYLNALAFSSNQILYFKELFMKIYYRLYSHTKLNLRKVIFYNESDKRQGICPKCGRILDYDPYFNAFICHYCGYESERLTYKVIYRW